MGISMFVQTAHDTELSELQSFRFDDALLLEVLSSGIRRGRGASDEQVTTESMREESLAEAIVPRGDELVDFLVGTCLRPPGAPRGVAVSLCITPIMPPELAGAGAPVMRHAQRAQILRAAFPLQWQLEVTALSGWDMDDEGVDVVEEPRPGRGPYSSAAEAWVALRMLEVELIAAGHTPAVVAETVERIGWADDDVARYEQTRLRPHRGPCVLDLDKAGEAIAFATCAALRAAGCDRYARSARRPLLGCFGTHRDGQDMTVGSNVCYGPIQMLFSYMVHELDHQLRLVGEEQFASAWADADWPEAVGALSRERLKTEQEASAGLECFRELKAFVRSAAERGLGLMIHHW